MRSRRSWLLVLVVLALASGRPASAISPTFLMFYGGGLKDPQIVRLDPSVSSAFVWDAAFRKWSAEPGGKQAIGDLAASLKDRSFMSVAIFWGKLYKPELKPADAAQHGRLYLPTGSQPAVMVATPPDMQAVSHPIPDRLEGYFAGWILTAEDIAGAKALGVPGFE